MTIPLTYHKNRRNKLLAKWDAIASEYLSGVSVIELSKKYGYTRARIYQIFKEIDPKQVQTSS